MMKAIAVLALLSLTACGFEPVYGTKSVKGTQGSLAETQEQIRINVIPNREGQFLRNVLIDRLNRGGYPSNPRYSLSVEEIDQSLRDLDITIDSDTTRGQLRLQTTMTLTDLQTGATAISRQLHAITSYNILDSEFANNVSEQNACENALNDLAAQIVLQINLYLRRN
jgi:LPS-assembly lipoprotein